MKRPGPRRGPLHEPLPKVYFGFYVYLLFLSSLFIFIIYYSFLGSSSGSGGVEDCRERVPDSCVRGNGTVRDWGARPFKILFWTKWYGYYADGSGEFVKPECEDEFIVTSNKSECGDVDAIIFQYVDIYKKQKLKLPPSRDINVPWILSSQEAAIQRPRSRHTNFDGIFNWTWSFRSDSLIHPNFTELFDQFDKPDRRWVYGSQFSKEFLSNKKKVSAWVVSNCKVIKSKRNELVASLSELGIQIDKYGKCGDAVCEGGDQCFAKLGKTYKFYLALENSLCEDYITEKIYHGLLHGMVPVVYALGNVEMNAPPNSYINVLDFPTLSDLAERLKYLDRNPQEYFKYFEWRQYYNVNVTGSPRYQCHTWRKIKEFTMKLGTDEDAKIRHTYKHFDNWYSRFYNPKLGKRCEACLAKKLINVTQLSLNKQIMYNDSSRCI